MTPQEAIKTLNRAKESHLQRAGLDFIKALDLSVSALEKQIPKKPVIVGEEYIFEKDEWEKDYECSICGNPYADDSFCSCCGQKLDWSDAE